MHSKEEKSEYKSRSFGVTMETLERKISKEYMLNNEFKTIIPSPVNSKLTNSNPRS